MPINDITSKLEMNKVITIGNTFIVKGEDVISCDIFILNRTLGFFGGCSFHGSHSQVHIELREFENVHLRMKYAFFRNIFI